MAQRFVKKQNNGPKSKNYGKYFARPMYNRKAIGTDDIAKYIEENTNVRISDVAATLDELGKAVNYFLRRGERVVLKGIGTFKVGFSSLPCDTPEECTAATIFSPRVLFLPESYQVRDKQPQTIVDSDGKTRIVVGWTSVRTMLEGVEFEETGKSSGPKSRKDE